MKWIKSLFRSRQERMAALSAAKGDFLRSYGAYQDAMRRGDTRAQHDAWPALRNAMADRLRMGL